MKNEDLNDLLTSQLESAKIDYSRNNEIWKVLPNTDCQVGYDGRNSLLRLPMDNVESTNWKTENKLLRSRYSKTIQSFLQISFDIKNIEIITPFILELIKNYDNSEDDARQLFNQLLKEWSSYWSEITPIFTKEDQIGTLGELLVLEKMLISKNSGNVLKFWKAPDKKEDLHDFEALSGNLEIKTSSSVPRAIYVEHLDQMDEEIIFPKKLFLIFVKLIPGEEISLPIVVHRLRELCSDLGVSIEFNDMLNKRGYKNSEEEEYSQNKFDIEGFEKHIVNNDTPIHTSKDLKIEYEAVVSLKQIINPNKILFENIKDEQGWIEIINQIS